MRIVKTLTNEEALAWFEKEGMNVRELRFLRRAVACGHELTVEVMEGDETMDVQRLERMSERLPDA